MEGQRDRRNVCMNLINCQYINCGSFHKNSLFSALKNRCSDNTNLPYLHEKNYFILNNEWPC